MPTLTEASMLCTFIFLLQILFEFTRQLVENWSTFVQGAPLFMAIIPNIGVLSIPVSFVMATLLVYGRLAEEREITAMMAGGITLGRIIAPALILGGFLTLILLYWTHVVAPMSVKYSSSVVAKVLEQTISAGIKPGQFQKIGGGYALMTKEVDRDAKLMKRVQIFELPKDRNYIGFVIAAPDASFNMDRAQSRLVLDMENGFWHMYESTLRGLHPNQCVKDPNAPRGKNDTYNYQFEDMVAKFSTMHWSLNVSGIVDDVFKGTSDFADMLPWELAKSRKEQVHQIQELSSHPNRTNEQNKILKNMERRLKEFDIERASRISLPFSVIAMAAVAAPLGIMTRKGKKGAIVLFTLLVVFSYYALLMVGQALAKNGSLPPMISLWIPNLAAFATAFFFYKRASVV